MNKIDNKNLIVDADDSVIKTQRQISKLDQILAMLPFKFQNQKPIIAVLRLCGVIGKVGGFKSGLCLHSLNELIEKAFAIPKLQAICLSINSPGGSPVQSELIAKRIRTLARTKQIPVYSFVEDVAASGGYWLACAGNEIYASKSSIIGSIGVISSSFGFHEAIHKIGIERRVYTQGQNKSILDPFQPVKESDIKIIKQLQQQVHEHFIEYVKERRGGKLTQADDILFNGEFWSGESAHDFGLIDGIADMHSFISNKFGDDIKIEYIAGKQSWLKKKLGMAEATDLQRLTDHLLDSIEHKILYKKFDFH